MKPIRLEIEGINSYEKKQIIDFEKLISRGIFGIFGKTGSGKSTILDAITLSLYGNIARGTKGFINSNVKDAFVLFRFEIGNGNKRETYEILRKFKKVINEDKISSKSSSIKLLKINNINGEEIKDVIADKVKEADSKIYEILGLTEDDFLKSVVLPQGKFSEFLLLNGKSKRDMLERIFALEEYGTNLNNKLSIRKKKIENTISILNGKLAEFSNVTYENIKLLTKNSKEFEIKLNEFEKNIDFEQKKLNEYLEINELNIEKEKYLDELNLLKLRQNTIFEYEKKIDISKKISDIIIEINRKNDFENDLKIISTDGIKLKENLLKATEDLDRVKNTYNYFFEIINKIPEIKSSNLLVKRIFENEEEFLKNIFCAKNFSSSISNLSKFIEETKENISKLDFDLEKYSSKILNNRKIQTENNFSIEFKEDIEKASELEKNINLLVKNENELELKLKSLENEIEKINLEKKEIENNLETAIKTISKKEFEFKDIKNIQMVNEIRSEILSHKEENCSCPVCGNEILNFDFKNTKEYENLSEKLLEYNEDIENLTKVKEDLNSNLIKLDILFSEKNKISIEIKDEISKNKDEILKLKENLLIYNKKYDLECFENEKIKIQNLDKLFLKIRDENLYLEKKAQEIRDSKIKIEKELNEKILEFELIKNRSNENNLKIRKILNELNLDLKELNFDYLANLIGFKEKITNLENFENLMEIVVKKDIEILKNLYYFSNDFCQNAEKNFSNSKLNLEKVEAIFKTLRDKHLEKQGEYKTVKSNLDKQIEKTNTLILERGFSNENEVKLLKISDEELNSLENFIENHKKSLNTIETKINLIDNKLKNRFLEENELEIQKQKYKNLSGNLENTKKELIETNLKLENMKKDIKKVEKFTDELNIKNKELNTLFELEKVLKGKKFVEFLSKIYLKNIVYDASQRLDLITNGRYSLEIDSEYSFVVSDNFNGGIRRTIDTLSGGEIFLTSLSLALALSTQIQLKGSAPLEFFFLDEGFGTLDRELLEIVIESLEKLQSKNLSVGVISHIEELKNRIESKLIVNMDKEKLTSVVNVEYS